MLHIFNHYENKKYSKFYRSNKNANVIKLSREIYLKSSPKLWWAIFLNLEKKNKGYQNTILQEY